MGTGNMVRIVTHIGWLWRSPLAHPYGIQERVRVVRGQGWSVPWGIRSNRVETWGEAVLDKAEDEL